MRNTNMCFIHGRIGRDPEIRFLPSGTPMAKFSLCSNDDYFDSGRGEWVEVAEWHDCVVVGDYAEKVAEKYQKGDDVNITCRVKPRMYEKNGQKFKVVEMYVSSIELIAKAGAASQGQQRAARSAPRGGDRQQGRATEQDQEKQPVTAGGVDDDYGGQNF